MFGLSSLATYAIAAALIFASGAASGWRVEAWHRDSVDEKRVEAAVAERQKAEAKIAEVSAAYEAERAKRATQVKTITRTVDRIVEKPVYKNSCLDADGIAAVNAAMLGGAAEQK